VILAWWFCHRGGFTERQMAPAIQRPRAVGHENKVVSLLYLAGRTDEILHPHGAVIACCMAMAASRALLAGVKDAMKPSLLVLISVPPQAAA
jgi:hypothetical protein